LFHFHTTYTDSSLSIEDYFYWAKEREISILIFCEHVKKNLNYSFDKFVKEINSMSKKYKIKYLLGVEAKLLPNGELDISYNLS